MTYNVIAVGDDLLALAGLNTAAHPFHFQIPQPGRLARHARQRVKNMWALKSTLNLSPPGIDFASSSNAVLTAAAFQLRGRAQSEISNSFDFNALWNKPLTRPHVINVIAAGAAF